MDDSPMADEGSFEQRMVTVYEFDWGDRQRTVNPKDFADDHETLLKCMRGLEYLAALGRKDDDCDVTTVSYETF
jgi:hypothetical protein